MTDGWTTTERLTPEEAFAAMFEFLKASWQEFKTANVADVLSDLQPAAGGVSSGPATWSDWLRAVERVTQKRS